MENTILWLVGLLLVTFPFLWSLEQIQIQSQSRERSLSNEIMTIKSKDVDSLHVSGLNHGDTFATFKKHGVS